MAHTGRGYNIGVRLIEDFLARTGQGKCKDFRDTADVLSKVRSPDFPRGSGGHGGPDPIRLGSRYS